MPSPYAKKRRAAEEAAQAAAPAPAPAPAPMPGLFGNTNNGD